MLPGVGLSAGGGLSFGVSATSDAKAGPITVGGLTFGPQQSSSQLVPLLIVAGVAIAALVLFAKAR